MKSEVVEYKFKDEQNEVVEGEVLYSFPETVEEAVQKFGEATVMSHLNRNIKIALQAVCRGSESPEAAQKIADSWVPGITRTRSGGSSSIEAKAKKALDALDMDAIKKLLAEKGISIA